MGRKSMKLKLFTAKKYYNSESYVKPNRIKFAVIDLDISRKYPENFVCILPRNINLKIKDQNQFQEKFKEHSLDVAKQLLNKALVKEKDQDLIKEINNRLEILNPKPKNIAKCNRCGKDFQPRKFGYAIQKTCYNCWKKSRSEEDYCTNFY